MSDAPSAAPAAAPSSAAPAQGQAAQQNNPATPNQQTQQVSQAAPQKAPETPKKWKLKIDGQDQEFNEEELIKHAQMGKASQKRFEESAQLRKQVENFVNELRTNPKKVLSDPSLSIDLRKFAEEIINEEVEELKKSPEQREKEALQKQLEEMRAKQKETEERAQQAEMMRLQEQETIKIDSEITTALETSGLPKSPYIVKRMADYMLLALQNGVNLDVKDVVPLVRKEIGGDLKSLFSASPDELLEDLIGKEGISRFRKKAISKAKAVAPTASSIKSTGNDIKESKAEPATKKMTMKEFLKL